MNAANTLEIVPLADEPLDALLALNNADAAHTSFLDLDRLRAMLAAAFSARGIAGGGAMLIAFDQDAAYDGANFLWFRARYPRFVYVDRIITAPSRRGQGCARILYNDLFARAASASHDMVGCEVNLAPPNPVSDAFHHAMGFAELGQATFADSGKTVRYLARRIGE